MAYGYPGDATPDSNSLAGKGDRDNQLSATQDHQSVALTLEGRYQRFGVWGKSTGEAFVENGQTYYDDDTAPTTFTYQGETRHNPASLIDVYDPTHPPDKLELSSGHADRQTDWSKGSDLFKAQEVEPVTYPGQLRGAEEAEEEIYARERAEVTQPKDQIFAPENIIGRIKTRFPEAFKGYSDEELYKALKEKYPNPLDLLKEAYPEYKSYDKTVLGKALKEKFFKDISQDEFDDRFNPDPNPVTNFFHKITEQAPNIIPGWYNGLAELAKAPERATGLWDAIMQKLGMTQAQQKQIQSLTEKVFGTPPEQYERDPNTGQIVTNQDKDRQVAQKLAEFGQRETQRGQKYVQQHPIAPAQGVVGLTAEKGFQGIGAAPSILPSFMPGMPASAALVLGMVYDTVQGYGKAREKGLDNDMIFGAEGAGYRVLQEWFLHSPRGRLLSAFLWAAGGVGDQAVQDFLSGKKSTLNDYLSTAAVNSLFGGIFSTGRGKTDLLDKAIEARQNGNYELAGYLLDRQMLLLGDIERKTVTNNLLAWRNEAVQAAAGDNPLEMPGQRGFILLKDTRSLRERVTPPEELPPTGEPSLELRTGAQAPRGIIGWTGEQFKPRPSVTPSAEELQTKIVPRETSVFPSEPRPKATDPLQSNAKFLSQEQAVAPSPAQVPAKKPVPLEHPALPAGVAQLDYLHRLAYEELVRRGSSPARAFEGVSRSTASDFHGILKEASRTPKSPADHITDQFYYSGIDPSKLLDDILKWGERLGRTPFGRTLRALGREREQLDPGSTQFDLDPNMPVTPAVRAGGKVFPSWSHGGAYEKAGSPTKFEIGYVDRKGKFLDSKEGAKIEEEYLARDRPPGEQLYYSGIDVGKVWEDITKAGEWIAGTPFGRSAAALGQTARDVLAPEHVTPTREATGAIMGSEIRNMQMRNQQFAQSWYKQQRLIDQFKFAYEQEQRRAFWDNNRGPTWDRNSKLKHWFELHEARRSTGNPVADRMFALHDGLMNALNRWDQSHGFTYNLRESYIYHALKNPERDLPALENKIRQMRWGDPDFMHPRQIPTIEMLHALGFELQTYNLEDIDQMRLEASSRAEFKAKSLENLREAHLAFTQDDLVAMQARMLNAFHAAGRIPPKNFEAQAKTFFDKLKEQTDLWRSPRAKGPGDKHETYFVHKEASWMLHRATDPVIWHPALGGFVTFAQSLKQRTTGLNLGWSALHQLHMLSIGAAQTTTLVMRKFLEGTGNLGDLAKAIADTVTLGGFSHIKSLYHNQALLNWYQTGDPQFLHNLTPFEREMLELHEEGGFIPSISHERQIQIERLLSLRNRQITFETLRNRPVSLALDLGYALLSARPYQQWLFGRVIPSLKQYAYDAQALALKEARPDLWRPQNTLQRRIELRKIRDLVDIRFGEQNLRQSFADPHIKAFGQAVLLSYSWNKSMIETYGGAIHDIEKASSSDFLKAIREEGLRPASERFLTNRLIYGLMLTGFSAASNMMIASLLGDGVQSGQDLIYPNIGKGPDGKLKRVKPPQWLTTDLFGLMKDVAQEGAFWPGFLVFAGNKMQASLSTLYNIWGRGKDYFGNDIADEEKIKASLQQLLPFMAQQGLQPGMTPRDIILGMLGLPPAPKSASRTAGENLIMNLYTQYHVPRGTEAYVHQQIQAREEYRQALLARNQTAAQTAVQKMKGLGMTEKAIRNVEQNLHTSTAELHFKHSLDADEQARVLREMQGDELKRYWHLAKPEARHKYEQPDPSERPGLIKYIPEWIP